MTTPFLRQLTLRNLLSFGPKTEPFQLGSLNVLIGPNGSGKSNFIEVLSLLRASARDLRSGLKGGVSDWIWKGDPKGVASLEAILANPHGQERQGLRHRLAFRAEQQTFQLEDERIENEAPYPGQPEAYFYYRYQHGQPVLNIKNGQRRLTRENVELNQSILPQRRDPDTYPEISYLASMYERIRLYREWSFGRSTIFRAPQQTDLRSDRLEEDFSNLGMFLNRLRLNPKAKSSLLNALRDL
ncbi:MAG: AAA family ATPase, partial [Anaerolineae bacterium]